MPIKKSIQILLLSSLFISASAWANNNSVLSLGYAYIKIKDAPALNGISLKIQSAENSKKVALQISATIAQKYWINNQRLRYGSLSMGPVYSVIPSTGLYAIIGVSSMSDKMTKENQLDNSSKSLSWGTGVTFTPKKNILLTLGYEGGYFKIAGKDLPSYGFTGSIGYRF